MKKKEGKSEGKKNRKKGRRKKRKLKRKVEKYNIKEIQYVIVTCQCWTFTRDVDSCF